MALEQQYSIVHVANRLEDTFEEEEEDLECYRDELDAFRVWLRKESFDRREINRRLRQYANQGSLVKTLHIAHPSGVTGGPAGLRPFTSPDISATVVVLVDHRSRLWRTA